MASAFSDDGPSFFTLLHHRRIPAVFKGMIGERYPCVIYLKVSSGPWFKIVVCDDDNEKLAMREGLKGFLLSNNITMSNFLVFCFDGVSSFHVQVFEPSGLERVPENKEQLETIGTPNGKRKPGRPRKYGKDNHVLRGKKEQQYQDYGKEPSKKIPAFFKAFITEEAHRRLNIPLAFTEYLEGKIAHTAFLRNRKSYVWTVTTTKSRNQYSFDNGWPGFVEQNDVHLGDFLVFQYDGKCTFDFKHFGTSMCEKEAKILSFKIEEEYGEGFDREAETSEKKYADSDNSFSDVNDENDGDEDDEGDNDVVLEDEKDVGEDAGYDYDDDNFDGDEDVEGEDVDEEVSVKDVETNEEDAIFKSGIVERPKNPYFVAKILPSRRSDLFVPSDVIKDFNLKLPKDLCIFVKHGRRWKTEVKVWKDGRTVLSKGWRPICKWNNLQLDDRCICEFVPGDGEEGLFLQMTIVRAGSW
ncbi:hypothetical protein ACET3Z_022000 [Daucus carota]